MTPKQIATLIIENIHENNGLIYEELLIEEITKTNFFDLYIADTNQEDKEIQSYRNSLIDIFYDEMFYKLATIVLSRWWINNPKDGYEGHDEHSLSIATEIYKTFIDRYAKYLTGTEGQFDYEKVKQLSPQEVRTIMQGILKLSKTYKEKTGVVPVSQNFTSVTWEKLAKLVMRTSQATAYDQKMVAIDQIFQATHHGGNVLIDYLSDLGDTPLNWLSQALDLRFASNDIKQLLPYASNYMKSQLRYKTVEKSTKPVSQLDLLATRLNRDTRLSYLNVRATRTDDGLVVGQEGQTILVITMVDNEHVDITCDNSIMEIPNIDKKLAGIADIIGKQPVHINDVKDIVRSIIAIISGNK